MEEHTIEATIREVLEEPETLAYHTEQAGYGNELRLHCIDGDVVFAQDKINRKGVVLTYKNNI